MQAELPITEIKRGGRPQATTAKAWISRRKRSAKFQSNVYHDGRVHTLVTGTAHRAQALDFNRSHLVSRLTRAAPPQPVAEQQLELPVNPLDTHASSRLAAN